MSLGIEQPELREFSFGDEAYVAHGLDPLLGHCQLKWERERLVLSRHDEVSLLAYLIEAEVELDVLPVLLDF